MKLASPFTILGDVLKKQTPESPICLIDETEVSLKECRSPIEDKEEVQNLDFWDDECEQHPTTAHCIVFDE